MKKVLSVPLIVIIIFSTFTLVHAWSVERPGGDITIGERTESGFTDNNASVGLGAVINNYYENFSDYGRDFVHLNVSMTANSRKGIAYTHYDDSASNWWVDPSQFYDRSQLDVGNGIDQIITVAIPQDYTLIGNFVVRFFGGYLSGEYQTVYVSTNGFVSFDNRTQSTPQPTNIPCNTGPYALVAGVWSDLAVDGTGSIVTGLTGYLQNWYFVIAYNHVKNEADGQYLTFEIFLGWDRPRGAYDDCYMQSKIAVCYKTTPSISSNFTWGIQDQFGGNGVGGMSPGSSLSSLQGKTRVFSQSSDSYFLKKLTLSFYDPTSGTQFEMRTGDDSLRGYNLARQYSGPSIADLALHFAGALFGTAVLLGSVAIAQPEGVAAGAGLIANGVSVSWTWIDSINSLAQLQMNDSAIDIYGYNNGSNSVYNVGSAVGWPRDRVCDATLSLMVHWVLGSPTSTGNQTVVINATATYFPETTSNYAVGSDINVTTTLTLNTGPDNNNDMAHATWINTLPTAVFYRQYIGKYDTNDFFSFEAATTANINITVVANESYSDYPDLHLLLYDPTGANRLNSSSGSSSTLLYNVTDHTGAWYVNVHCDGHCGFYTLWFDEEYPPGSGGCPYVCSWNGTQYVVDNNLLPKSETSNGTDVADYYGLEQPLEPTHTGRYLSSYSLRISEFEHEHSYLDQVKLYAVDHAQNVCVAVSPTGQVLSYQNPRAPVLAQDENGKDWLEAVSSIDNNYYQSVSGEYLTLSFGQVNSNNAKLVLREDWIYKCSIHVQLLMTNGSWTEISDIPGRVNWATDILDFSPYLQTISTPLTVRLCFTAEHRIDYVGLDTTPQANVQTSQALPVSALHSQDGNVLPLLILKDGHYAELTPGQYITITFLLPTQNSTKARTFILFLNGHYFTIQQ